MNFLRKHKVKILIISFILCLFLLYIFFKPFKEILSIIIISAIIAYILNPIKKYLINKKSLKEKKATLIIIIGIILFIIGILVILIPTIFKELNNLGEGLEVLYNYIESFEEKSKFLQSPFLYFIYSKGKEKISYFFIAMSQSLVDNIISYSENILSLALIPIVVYYFLSDGKNILKNLYLLIPVKKRMLTKKIAKDIDKILVKYILSQIFLSFLIGIITLIVLLVLDIKLPIVLSILNGIFNIIPYFGPILGAIPILLIALMDSFSKCLWSAIAIFIIQQIEGNILSPKITGDSTNIHPLVIVILLLVGEKFGGFIGMILVIPIAVVIKVIYEDVNYSLFS